MYYMCLYTVMIGARISVQFGGEESVQQHMMDKCHCRIFFEEDAALEYAEFFDKAPSNAGAEEV